MTRCCAVSTATPRLPTDDEIPVIDLTPIDDTLKERKTLASSIEAASENTGFFYIRNHGIPEELIQNSLSQVKTFFNQPLSQKMKIDLVPQRFRLVTTEWGAHRSIVKRQEASYSFKILAPS